MNAVTEMKELVGKTIAGVGEDFEHVGLRFSDGTVALFCASLHYGQDVYLTLVNPGTLEGCILHRIGLLDDAEYAARRAAEQEEREQQEREWLAALLRKYGTVKEPPCTTLGR